MLEGFQIWPRAPSHQWSVWGFTDLHIQMIINQLHDESFFLVNDKRKGLLYTAHVLVWNPSTHTLCSQIASNTAPHRATGCVFITAQKHCVEFRVHQLRGCQPDWDSNYPGGRCLCHTIFFCHPPMIDGLLRSKRSPNSNFCYHQFRSTQFGGRPLLLEAVCQFKDTF